MNLLWQLLPYGILAVLAFALASVYVAGASARRIRSRPSGRPQRASTPLAEGIPPAVPVASAKAQIERLHEFGITAAQIGSVLQVPQEEVELVIRLGQYRKQPVSASPEPVAVGSRASRRA
jgi:hypothetical protein